MKRISRLIRILSINIITVLVLLFIVNQICGYTLRGSGGTPRHALPNYKEDVDYAKKIFGDYNSIQHIYQPFVGWQTKPYNGPTTTIDESGFRVHSSQNEPTDSAKTVRFFGGSTMWGEGSDDNNTIAALYNSYNPEHIVKNHGQLAYNSRQNLESLITLYNSGESSDIVLFYDGVNDAAFLCPTEITVPGHRLVPLFQKKLYTSKSQAIFQVLDKIFTEKIRIVVNNMKNPDPAAAYSCISDPDKAEEIANFMISNWEIAHNLVEDQGGEFYAVLQPVSFVGNPKLDHLDLEPALRDNFIKVYDLLKKKLAEKNYPWVLDLTHAFDNEEYVYIDFCHVSKNGNQIVSKAIDEFISTSQLEPLE